MKDTTAKKVAVVGTGRVGLPLALSLIEAGAEVIGVETDGELAAKINSGVMPFHEPGYEKLITSRRLQVSEDYAAVSDRDYIIITVGTPLLPHIETDLESVKLVSASLVPYLQKEQCLILRSTVAPGTTEFVGRYIAREKEWKQGEDFYLCFCPERISEGNAYKELRELPQIIGSEDENSTARAEELFSLLVEDRFKTDFVSAELTKLFNNISRYVYFGVSNYFAVVAEEYGANIYDIIDMANYKYPRTIVASPGFTAGTCLRKDFGMINENIPFADMLLSAWKVNEYIPRFVISLVKKRLSLFEKTIGVLGMTFKADSDDTRDSLVPKLIRYLEREVPRNILVHEPNITEALIANTYRNSPLEEALGRSDVVIFAINHSVFKKNYFSIIEQCEKNALIVDVWNMGGMNKLLFTREEALAYG